MQHKLMKNRWLQQGMVGSLLLMFLIISTGCSVNPATGRSQLNMMSTQDEIALGTQAMPTLITEYGGEVADKTLREYVTRVGMHLAKQTEADNPDLPWEFTLLDSDVINAFALPGGKVFISLGLMAEMSNEAQLAGVLGHEIGHVTARHINDRMVQEAGVSVFASILTSATKESDYSEMVGLVVGVGGTGFILKYSRSQESESDTLGIRYMTRAGYDPIGQLQVMQILESAQEEAGGAGAPEWLSTHPYPTTRIDDINHLLASDYASTQNNPEYQLYEDRFQRTASQKLATLMQAKTKGSGSTKETGSALDAKKGRKGSGRRNKR